MLTADNLSLAHFILFPVAILCLQYGWDMVFDDIVPMSRTQIARRLNRGED